MVLLKASHLRGMAIGRNIYLATIQITKDLTLLEQRRRLRSKANTILAVLWRRGVVEITNAPNYTIGLG